MACRERSTRGSVPLTQIAQKSQIFVRGSGQSDWYCRIPLGEAICATLVSHIGTVEFHLGRPYVRLARLGTDWRWRVGKGARAGQCRSPRLRRNHRSLSAGVVSHIGTVEFHLGRPYVRPWSCPSDRALVAVDGWTRPRSHIWPPQVEFDS